MHVVLEDDGSEIGDELLGPIDQELLCDTDNGDLEDDADHDRASVHGEWEAFRAQILRGESGSEPSQAKALIYAHFREALTVNRPFWAAEAALVSSAVSRARSTLRALANQYHAESEALSARIHSGCKSGNPVCSIELETLVTSWATLITLASNLDYPADMYLMPDPYEVANNTVLQLWDQYASLCMEYEAQSESLTDAGRTLEFLASVPYRRRTWPMDEAE